MATTYDKASLVMIPSGVKEDKLYSIKPTDGSGDFTFSRGSDIQATRVNSSGLIEKAKVNELLQSNQFDTTWTSTSTNASVTSGQSDPNGGSTAWLVTESNDGGSIRQSVSVDGVLTFSMYLKYNSGAATSASLFCTDNNQNASFNLSTGVVSGLNNLIDASMVDVGGGWYRCSVTFNASAASTMILFPNNGAGVGSCFAYRAQLNHGLIAQDYVETTTTAVVEGLTADLPRLDYSGGASCPSLLLEPSRTNIVDQSEYVGGYTKSGSVITQNDAVSPEGVQNAFKINDSNIGTTGVVDLYQSVSVSTSTDYTFSVFAKKGSDDFIHLRTFAFTTPTDGNTYFDLSNGTIGTTHAGHTPFIEDYGNGWYRCGITFTTDSSDTTGFIIARVSDADNSATMLRDGTHNVYMYGFQFEAGSYPTSYIPTYGAAANRGADKFISGDISSYIGNSEFVLFAELSSNNESADFNQFGISDGTTDNMVYFNKRPTDNTIGFVYENNNVTQLREVSVSDLNANNKLALRYTSGVVSSFANGTKATDITGLSDISSTLDQLQTGRGTYNGSFFEGSIKQLLIFPTALTDAECIALTTI